MKFIFYLTLTILLSLSVSETDEEYDYDYDEEVPVNKTKSGGARLIGARAARTSEAPFVVAIARVRPCVELFLSLLLVSCSTPPSRTIVVWDVWSAPVS